MDTITLTSSNLKSLLRRSDSAYFVIDDTVAVDSDITFPSGSVIEFCGGCFSAASAKATVSINLNGSSVKAPAYGIFPANAKVTNFANSLVHSDWFKTEGRSESQAINDALVAAQGCPVTLEARSYLLDETIVFPAISGSPLQTLISPGTIEIADTGIEDEDGFVAIDLNVSNVRLNINKIKYRDYVDYNNPTYYGTAIRFSGLCQNIEVNILEAYFFKKAISIKPRNGLGVEFCKIKFQLIYSEYCIYIDPFTNSNQYSQTTWFSETVFEGGQIRGMHGVYFAEPQSKELSGAYGSNNLSFYKIGFEGITHKPLVINRLHSSSFTNLRMAESLPGLDNGNTLAKWVWINNATNIDISIKFAISPNRFEASENVSKVVVKAWFTSDIGWPIVPFDTLVFNPAPNSSGVKAPLMAATSSIQPLNMCATLTPTESKEYNIYEMLPSITSGTMSVFVLPRALNIITSSPINVTLDFTGLQRFGLSFFDIYFSSESGGVLDIKYKNENLNLYEKNLCSGLYRLAWDENWNLTVSQIS